MKLKLNLMNLNPEEDLYKEEMGKIYAGAQSMCVQSSGCACGCAYAGSGGSSTSENMCANDGGGLHSPGLSYNNATGKCIFLICPDD